MFLNTQDLPEHSKGTVIYQLLIATLDAFDKIFEVKKNPFCQELYDAFLDKNFIKNLESWHENGSVSEQDNQEKIVTGPVHKMITYFESPPEYTSGWEVFEGDKIYYLINYHILRFIKTYHRNYEMKQHFEDQDSISYEIFEKQLKLFESGFQILEAVNKVMDCYYFLTPSIPSDAVFKIPGTISASAQQEFHSQSLQKSQEYSKILDELLVLSRGSLPLKKWMLERGPHQEILRFFGDLATEPFGQGYRSNSNLWLIRRYYGYITRIPHDEVSQLRCA